MNGSPEATGFTEKLISLIRQQRHLSTRVIIATQEPTLSPQPLDLCDVSIIHRFRSPAWLEAVKNHLAGMIWTGDSNDTSSKSVFDTIVGLGDGEALLFCPNAYLDAPDPVARRPDISNAHNEDDSDSSQSEGGMPTGQSQQMDNNPSPTQDTTRKLTPLSTAYIKLQIRKRVTADGGKSLMA